jgi:hemolysin activation/secretion protein
LVAPTDDGALVQERFADKVTPRAQAPSTTLQLPSTTPSVAAQSITLNVASIAISGSTVYSDSELAELTRSLIGTRSLNEIYDLAQKLTAQYSNDGYILSRVIVPPQELDSNNANVRLKVIEGWADEVVWPEATRAYRDFFTAYSRKITAQKPLNIRTLERYLLLAGDLPGLSFSSSLEPSDTPGASRVVVSLERKRFDAAVSVDNAGTEGRGPYQFSVGSSANNLLRAHERFSGTVAGSFQTDELLYGQLRFEQVLSAEGLTASITVNADRGAPGTAALQTLLFESRSLSVVGELSFPAIRSRSTNLTLFGQAYASSFTSDTLGTRFNEDRLRGVRLGLRYDQFDQWNGITEFTTTLSQGINGLGSTSNTNALASRTNGRVDFTKLEATVGRTQSLGSGFSVVGRVEGQYAFTPLLASEECGYGGAVYGRAFAGSVVTGDHCMLAMAEVRYDLPNLPTKLDQAQLFGFVDYGKAWRRAPAAGVAAAADAASTGLGLRLRWDEAVSGEFTAAHRLHGPIGANPWRATFSLSARY